MENTPADTTPNADALTQTVFAPPAGQGGASAPTPQPEAGAAAPSERKGEAAPAAAAPAQAATPPAPAEKGLPADALARLLSAPDAPAAPGGGAGAEKPGAATASPAKPDGPGAEPTYLTEAEFAELAKGLPKGQAAWVELKKNEKKLQRELEAQRKELAGLREKGMPGAAASPEGDAELKKARAEAAREREDMGKKAKELEETNARLTAIVEEVRLEQSPRFQQKIAEPLAKAEAKLRAAVKRTSLNPDDLLKVSAIESEDERVDALRAALGEVGVVDSAEIMRHFGTFAELQRQKKELLANAPQVNEVLAKGAAQEEEGLRKKFVESIQEEFPKARGGFLQAMPFFRPIEGNDAFNGAVDEMFATAQRLAVHPLKRDQMCHAMIQSAAFPMAMEGMKQTYKAWVEERKNVAEEKKKSAQLEDRIKELTAGTPPVEIGGGGGAPAGEFPQNDADFFRKLRPPGKA